MAAIALAELAGRGVIGSPIRMRWVAVQLVIMMS